MRYAIRQGSLIILALIVSLLLGSVGKAQQTEPEPANGTAVPRLVSFSGTALDRQGRPIAGTVGITFAIYQEPSEGTPLWVESQNVHADAKGNYRVQLGASQAQGLPPDLFGSGEARWLGVRVNGGVEEPRVLLVSVPYALKAADAQTLGGLPASAFQLALPAEAISGATPDTLTALPLSAGTTPASTVGTKPVTTAGGTANKLAKFDATADLTNSQIFDNGTNVGIGNSAPGAKLDVSGGGIFRGPLTLPATGAATATAGKNSEPQNFTASAFNSGAAAAVNETFRWQAEPLKNNTPNPSGKLDLLFGSGSTAPAETGLSISNQGIISFALGQTFPGAGAGTVKSVGLSAPASDFSVSGSPVTSSGTLSLQWLIPPSSLNSPNAIVKRGPSGDIQVNALFATSVIEAEDSISGSINRSGSGLGAIVGNNTNNGTGEEGDGVAGFSDSGFGSGVIGRNFLAGFGVTGRAEGTSGQGVWGESFGTQLSPTGFSPDGVDGFSHSELGSGVAAVNTTTGDGLFAQSNGGFAAFFLGNVDVDGDLAVAGNVSKAGGSFKIDDPLDPANKYLSHSFVESPDMMNIYNGNVTTDGQGRAVVQLPEWLEALNRDFRYQLTVIGQFAQAMVASEMANHSFTIQTDKPNVKVSWQVTGIRQDAWANAHRIPVEELKPEKERGLYLHPELFGAPAENSIAAAYHPGVMKLAKESKAKLTDSTQQ